MKTRAIKRILVPVDFSTNSLDALDYAVQFAKLQRAAVVVMHVIEPSYPAGPLDLSGAGYDFAFLLRELERVGRQQLAKLEAGLVRRGVRVSTRLQVGSPPALIIDAARRLKADLIIVSTHGRTGLSHMLMGSVAERVVRTAGCPVLTVRAVPPARHAKSKGRRRAAV
jgi:nucleotide-binding universal stress UspA family protein